MDGVDDSSLLLLLLSLDNGMSKDSPLEKTNPSRWTLYRLSEFEFEFSPPAECYPVTKAALDFGSITGIDVVDPGVDALFAADSDATLSA